MRSDQRSHQARQYRHLYSSRAWKAAKKAQRAKQPLCERCLKQGRITAMEVVNHRVPHKGDWGLFTDPENHESACRPHHDSTIQGEEKRGFSGECDTDGWPTDPRHPANRR
jgi:5-methylcytosine-specific restriction protein A